MEGVKPITLSVLRRKIENLIGVYFDSEDNQIKFRMTVFSNTAGESTVNNVISELEEGKKIIIDTSILDDQAELLIGSVIAHGVLNNYKRAKEQEQTK